MSRPTKGIQPGFDPETLQARGRRLTITDIALAAGVTKSTASLALNNSPKVAETTRQAVLAVARRLHYHPNEAARRLATGQADTIAFISPRIAIPFQNMVLSGVEVAAQQRGIRQSILAMSLRNDPDNMDRLLREILYGRRADGTIILTVRPSAEISQEYRRHNLPLVTIEDQVEGAHSVRVDNVLGARLAVGHLAGRGRRQILLLNGLTTRNDRWEANPTAIERQEGYRQALREAGLPFQRDLVAICGSYTPEEGVELFRKALERKPRIDAIFCAAGDLVALAVMAEAERLGLGIPKDLALVGFDDILPASLVKPSLSTVRQPMSLMGEQALTIVMDAMEGKLKQEQHVLFKPELVVRGSS